MLHAYWRGVTAVASEMGLVQTQIVIKRLNCVHFGDDIQEKKVTFHQAVEVKWAVFILQVLCCNKFLQHFFQLLISLYCEWCVQEVDSGLRFRHIGLPSRVSCPSQTALTPFTRGGRAFMADSCRRLEVEMLNGGCGLYDSVVRGCCGCAAPVAETKFLRLVWVLAAVWPAEEGSPDGSSGFSTLESGELGTWRAVPVSGMSALPGAPAVERSVGRGWGCACVPCPKLGDLQECDFVSFWNY